MNVNQHAANQKGVNTTVIHDQGHRRGNAIDAVRRVANTVKRYFLLDLMKFTFLVIILIN